MRNDMSEFMCLKDSMAKSYGDFYSMLDDSLRLQLCRWCRLQEYLTLEDNILRLIIEPFYVLLVFEAEMKSKKECLEILQELQKGFNGEDNGSDEDSILFYIIQKIVENNDKSILKNYLTDIPVYSYIGLLIKLFSGNNISIYKYITILYYLANVKTKRSAFRLRSKFREKTLYFDIGVSLDEGCIEYYTEKLLQKYSEASDSSDFEGNKSTTYFFETRFFKRIQSLFYDGDDIDILEKQLDMNEIDRKSKEFSNCFLYDLLSMSDQQDWIEANKLLRSFEEYLS